MESKALLNFSKDFVKSFAEKIGGMFRYQLADVLKINASSQHNPCKDLRKPENWFLNSGFLFELQIRLFSAQQQKALAGLMPLLHMQGQYTI